MRRFILGVLLLAAVATTGCGFRARNAYRCCPQPALMPAVAVPVSSNCCPPPCCP